MILVTAARVTSARMSSNCSRLMRITVSSRSTTTRRNAREPRRRGEYRDGHTKETPARARNAGRRLPLGEYAHRDQLRRRGATYLRLQHRRTFAVAEFRRQRGVGKPRVLASSTKFAIEGDGLASEPHSFTKATNVDLINDYGRWFDLDYAICYFYNAFGPREVGTGRYATLIARFQKPIARASRSRSRPEPSAARSRCPRPRARHHPGWQPDMATDMRSGRPNRTAFWTSPRPSEARSRWSTDTPGGTTWPTIRRGPATSLAGRPR